MLRRVEEYVSLNDYHREYLTVFNAYINSSSSYMDEVIDLPGKTYLSAFLVRLNWYRDSISGYVIIKYKPNFIQNPELKWQVGSSYVCKICKIKNWKFKQVIWFHAIRQSTIEPLEIFDDCSTISLCVIDGWLCYLIYNYSDMYPISIVGNIRSTLNNIEYPGEKKLLKIFKHIIFFSNKIYKYFIKRRIIVCLDK